MFCANTSLQDDGENGLGLSSITTCAVTVTINGTKYQSKVDCASLIPTNSTDDEFSRLNIIGMFLTLQLCQLTQPYGSLLFRRGQLYLWRVNPISSFVEGCIIYWYLAKVVKLSWRRGFWVVLSELQQISTALLFLRTVVGPDPTRELFAKIFPASMVEEIPKSGSSDTARSVRVAPEPPQEAIMSGALIVDGPQQNVASRAPVLQHQPVDSADIADQRAVPPANPMIPATTQPAIELTVVGDGSKLASKPQRKPLVYGDPNTRLKDRPITLKERKYMTRQLQNSLCIDTRVHKQLRVDLVTTTSMLTILIKLCAVRINPWFRIICLFLIVGWSAVQFLLVLVHLDLKRRQRPNSGSHTKSNVHPIATVHKTLQLASTLNTTTLPLYICTALHLPFLLYHFYLLIYQPWNSTPRTDIAWHRVDELTGILLVYTFFTIGSVTGLFIVGFRRLWLSLLVVSTITAVFSWLILATVSHVRQNWHLFCRGASCNTGIGTGGHDANGIFAPDTLPYYLVDRSFDSLGKSSRVVWNTAVAGGLVLWFSMKGNRNRDGGGDVVAHGTWAAWIKLRGKALAVGNVLVTVVAFGVFLFLYDASGTYKPNWIDALG